ncbi:MAG: ATP-binding protein [Calditrichaeota bacterium]|nr:MAG: ATP-binding protein [Calditrichota bacterium]MBL1205835.1 ATP-binding protein [Calditrichota bacterium]NOG45662.1 ATP-binding protein [Calditrichota bacterium]
MRRKISKELLKWKNLSARKPLLLQGARQVGKTYCLEKLGKKEFQNYHFFDFMENPSLSQIFEQDLQPERIIRDLGLYYDHDIILEKDLIIFDEIQQCPKALTSLKFFSQKSPNAFIAASGSLLGLGLSDEPFPVGKVTRYKLYPMDFEEFLEAIGQKRLISILNSATLNSPVNEAIHQKIWLYYKYFMITGGLPEVVKRFSEKIDTLSEAFSETRKLQQELLKDYIDDITKHSGKIKAVRIDAVFKNVPIQLAKESNGVKKFVFKNVLPNASRYSSLEAPIEWLIKAGLVIKVPICNKAELPLQAYSDEKRFKLYMFDVGILGAMLGLSPKTIFSYDYGSYKGYFVENLVLTEIVSQLNKQIYSWNRNMAEIEFLLDYETDIIPIEVKAGVSTKAKSLSVYKQRYSPKVSFLLTGRPMLQTKSALVQLPLYMAPKLENYL